MRLTLTKIYKLEFFAFIYAVLEEEITLKQWACKGGNNGLDRETDPDTKKRNAKSKSTRCFATETQRLKF